MSVDELRELAGRADGVEGWPATRVEEVRARIGVARRRRAVGAVIAAVLAVVLAISATTALLAMRDAAHPHPVRQPRTLPTPGPETPTTSQRSLVWAEDQVVHVGDRAIDVGDEVVGIAGTDDGAVYTRGTDERRASCSTTYKCGDLWFTDGTETFVIGHAFGSVVRGWWVEVSASGSTVVWFEPSTRGTDVRESGEWVVYDTHRRQEVARFGGVGTEVHGVYDDTVYFSPTLHDGCREYSRYERECLRYGTVTRLDVATGRSTVVAGSAMADDQQHRPRSFLDPSVDGTNLPGQRYDPSPYFERDGDRLVLSYGNGPPVTPRLAGTGPLRLRIPADYPDPVGTEGFGFRMWLDDDRFTIAADFSADEVLVCRVSTGRCRVLVRGHETSYGFGGRG